ncbi:hypothetical protein D018_2037A, partial [Vibrio parahaemolyticus VP2007-007]
MIHRFATVT